MKANNSRGFTLIEVIIYLGLFAILFSGVIVAAYQLLQSGERNKTAAAIREEGMFLTQKITYELNEALAVASQNRTSLSITTQTITDTLFGDGDFLYLRHGNSPPLPLNSDAFHIKDLDIAIIPATSGMPPLVKITFALKETPFTFQKYLK